MPTKRVARGNLKFLVARSTAVAERQRTATCFRIEWVQNVFTRALALLVTDANQEVLQPLAVELNVPTHTTRRQEPSVFNNHMLKLTCLLSILPKVSDQSILQLRKSSCVQIDSV